MFAVARIIPRRFAAALAALVLATTATLHGQTCNRIITANVVAMEQPITANRLQATIPGGMLFALKQDTVDAGSSTPPCQSCAPGKVNLRPGKRPRPIALRMNVGDCLNVNFTNLLSTTMGNDQTNTRNAGFHVAGLELKQSIASDASWVGGNANSLAAPGKSMTYQYYAPAEGTFMVYSFDDGDPGQLINGLFGAVHVEPPGAEWYRSQVTSSDLQAASTITNGQRIVNYQATYSSGPQSGLPILNLLQPTGGTCQAPSGCFTIVHSDLTALITGPNTGNFTGASPSFLPNPASPDRREPYREFTIIYHNGGSAVSQATAFQKYYNDPAGPGSEKNGLPAGDQNDLRDVLQAASDGFGINYGFGGIGSEILANRLGTSNQTTCTECKFEEFFLSSWAVGDAAMPLDQSTFQSPYSDDPSNVYHSYLRDHVKFRIMNASSNGAHVHHQHAHQWLHTPNSDDSTYLDSQMILQGATFTLEMTYGGGGNKNLTAGDSIFHCHFYPHFAQGMWALWRVHDVFEDGTRMLPDFQSTTGTPIPAVVPIPTLAMAPSPAPVTLVDNGTRACVVVNGTPCNYSDPTKITNPGYPFFIPGVSGHRSPHPPMDFAWEESAPGVPKKNPDGSLAYLDGGLPRHLVIGGTAATTTTRLDFSKDYTALTAFQLPELGTPVEQAAMTFHAQRNHPGTTPLGKPAIYVTNGQKGEPGAPIAPPSVTFDGTPTADCSKGVNCIRYQAAAIEKDVVFNKAGWHFPQERLLTLWNDVAPTLSGARAPEPFFFRGNSQQTIEFWHTNLVPDYYQLDDFQIRTPTDIIGQHIHLVKFDVLASDGAANGFNYEDGTLSADDVRARINAINGSNPCPGGSANKGLYGFNPATGYINCNQNTTLTAKAPNPIWGPAPAGQNWTGAQTTIQKWTVDPLLNNLGIDRTLRTVFTHDHFGPSTHQQAGLYAGLLSEPANSKWMDASTGQALGGRSDGGPTGWEAIIQTQNVADSYREFALEFQDYVLAYSQGSVSTPDPKKGLSDPNHAIAPPQPNNVVAPPAPYPTAISTGPAKETFSVNYRSEPIPFRVLQPSSGTCSAQSCDLAYAFSSIARTTSALNTQPAPQLFPAYNPTTNPTSPQGTDPFTPLLRAYQGDKIQVRTLVGAHFTPHSFQIQGVNWLTEPSYANSGYRNNQGMGISEHFEMLFQLQRSTTTRYTGVNNGPAFTDYLYMTNGTNQGLANGSWGLMRAFDGSKGLYANLAALPNNTGGSAPAGNGPCPASAPKRALTLSVQQQTIDFGGGNTNPFGLVYVPSSGTVANEPAILRANAGDCITITVQNQIPSTWVSNVISQIPAPASPFGFGGNQLFTLLQSLLPKKSGSVPKAVSDAFNTAGYPLPSASTITSNSSASPPTWQIATQANGCTNPTTLGLCYNLTGGLGSNGNLANVVDQGAFDSQSFAYNASTRVSLHGHLVSYDAGAGNGVNAGFNADQTAGTGGNATLTWYAGNRGISTGTVSYQPVEFGAINLTPADQVVQHTTGLVGALIIEPQGATWATDTGTNASATVKNADGSKFREFVVIVQDDAQGAGGDSIDYKAQPAVDTGDGTKDISKAYSNCSVPKAKGTNQCTLPSGVSFPLTPIFQAQAKDQVRMRVLYPNGTKGQGDINVFEVHGHQWQEYPYAPGANSTTIGDNPAAETIGLQQIVPNDKVDLVIGSAGGPDGVPGDYKYGSFLNDMQGLWGILRVSPAAGPAPPTSTALTMAAGAPRVAAKARVQLTPAQQKAASQKIVAKKKADAAAARHEHRNVQGEVGKPNQGAQPKTSSQQ